MADPPELSNWQVAMRLLGVAAFVLFLVAIAPLVVMMFGMFCAVVVESWEVVLGYPRP